MPSWSCSVPFPANETTKLMFGGGLDMDTLLNSNTSMIIENEMSGNVNVTMNVEEIKLSKLTMIHQKKLNCGR
jgi:hypothetical protein